MVTKLMSEDPSKWTDPKMDPNDEFFGRIWMQNDALNDRESGEITKEVVKANDRRGNLRIVRRGEGNLISSMIDVNKHLPILDLDFAHRYVPSSTPGHGHLYLNHRVYSEEEHRHLIAVLAALEVLGKGSYAQLEAHGFSTTRPPGVTK